MWTERLDVAQYRDRQVDSLSLGNQQRAYVPRGIPRRLQNIESAW